MPRQYTRKADRHPAVVAQVFALLQRRDDFLTYPQVVEALPECNRNQVAAALSHLRKYKAAGAVPDDHGLLWWYATPDTDTRTKQVEQRVKEQPGNRTRRKVRSDKGKKVPLQE